MDGLTAPNFAKRHPRLSRDLGPRSLINDTPEPRNASGETQEDDTLDEAGSTHKGDKSLYTATSFEHVDVECNLLCGSPQPQYHPAYRTLGHKCIRLLKILPATPTAEIRCQLDEFTLHETLAYTALSYTWGSQHGVHRIYINDHPLLVPKNLWRFLNHARDLAGDLTGWIWCDMLSINQIDLAERGHQVKLMSRIFKTAQIVVVWLGPAYRGSDTAMTALDRLLHGKGLTKQALNIWAGDAGHAMSGICSRPYWRRLWVFQEIWLARKIRLMCGSKTVPWSHFRELMEHAHAISGISQLDDDTEAVANSPAMRMIRLSLESVNTVLWNLVKETGYLRCFDIRDKIYALLGVATNGHGSIEPDYSVPMPSLLNKLLHEIWSDSPPESLEEAADGCAKIEDVFGVERGTMFIMQGQRGRYNAPSNAEMRGCRLGPESSEFTLWWTAFYGHLSVQTLLRKSWTSSCFDGDMGKQSDAPSDARSMSSPVVSLFRFLRKDMDSLSSFLDLEDVHARPETEKVFGDACAGLTEVDISMAWVAFYLTDAVNRNDAHPTRLILDVGVGCGLLYTQYREIDTLIEATVGTLRSTIDEKDVVSLKAIFALAGPFVSDEYDFVTQMLDHGRTLDKCGLLLELGLVDMVRSSQRGFLLDMALSKALLNQNDEAIEALLGTSECDLNCCVSGGPALFHCMDSLQPKHLRALLNTGKCDLNLANPSNGMTPLMHAACHGLSAYASALIETGECRLNDANTLNGMTPLFYAASKGHTGVVRELLADDRCDVDTPHSDGKTALEMAREGRHDIVAELLLTPSGRKVNVSTALRNTPLDSAAARLNGLHRVRQILSKFNSTTVHPQPGQLLSFRTAARSFVELLACEDCAPGVESPCLDCQCIISRIETERTFLSVFRKEIRRERSNVDMDLLRELSKSDRGSSSRNPARADGYLDYSSTKLMLAAVRSPDGHPIVDALLRIESWNIDKEDCHGWTALMYAGKHGNMRHVESLLATNRCNIDKLLSNHRYSGYHSTVLHMAAALDHQSFLQQLLGQKGLDLCVQDPRGCTPLIVAVEQQKRKSVELLLGYEAGCGVNMKTGWYGGGTALAHAVENGDYHIVCLLVDSGRVKDMDDDDGRSLSSIARKKGHPHIQRVLVELAGRLQTRETPDVIGDSRLL
jgi:ankyrin repeat protein